MKAREVLRGRCVGASAAAIGVLCIAAGVVIAKHVDAGDLLMLGALALIGAIVHSGLRATGQPRVQIFDMGYEAGYEQGYRDATPQPALAAVIPLVRPHEAVQATQL